MSNLSVFSWCRLLAVATLVAFGSLTTSHSAVAAPAHLSSFTPGVVPPGFEGLCARYDWACRIGQSTHLDEASILSLARDINAKVNREIAARSDVANYGREELWSLPTNQAGDCEDYALLKMKELIEAGLPPSALLLALVVGSTGENHVVLVLRTREGDLILDSQVARIRTWNASRYTFIKMQSPRDRRLWDIVLMGPRARRA